MRDEEVKNLKSDFSWITLVDIASSGSTGTIYDKRWLKVLTSQHLLAFSYNTMTTCLFLVADQ